MRKLKSKRRTSNSKLVFVVLVGYLLSQSSNAVKVESTQNAGKIIKQNTKANLGAIKASAGIAEGKILTLLLLKPLCISMDKHLLDRLRT